MEHFEKSSSQRQQEHTVDMKPVQALVTVVTLICPWAARIALTVRRNQPWEEIGCSLSFLSPVLSASWLWESASLELNYVPKLRIARSCICYFMHMNIPGNSKVLLSISPLVAIAEPNLCAEIIMVLCVHKPNTDSDSWHRLLCHPTPYPKRCHGPPTESPHKADSQVEGGHWFLSQWGMSILGQSTQSTRTETPNWD